MLMWWLITMLCASFRCCFFGLVPITSRLWGSVGLRPFVFFVDSFFFLAGSQAKWPYPRNHFYLCLLFPNHASDSGDLYIDFNRNYLIFPAAHLVCQVDALLILFLLKHAYALHIMSCISCHVLYHVACALHRGWLWFPLLVFLPWVEPGNEYVIEEPVESANED